MPIPPYLAQLRRKIGHDLVLVPTIVVATRDAHGRLLVVHDRDAGCWTLPGGIIEPGETPADAAVREVWEETGVRVSLTGIVGVVGGPGCETTYRNGDRIAWVATFFAAVSDASDPVPDGTEIQAARFVTPADLDRLPLRADSARFLKLEVAWQSSAQSQFEPPTWAPAG